LSVLRQRTDSDCQLIAAGDVALLSTLVGRIRHVLQAVALGAGMTGAASAAYQGYGMARDRRRYPPLGELVDIGGRRLHLLRTPGAGPPLVIVAALGEPAIDWLAIQRALAPEVPVVLYDRGGLGWSDPACGARTAGRMADELHALLVAARIAPPYVLAGHSLGGLIALIYTARHRENVAGLALIDSSHPDMLKRLPVDTPLISGRAVRLLYAARWRLTPLGLVRLADDLGIRQQASDQARRSYPPDVAAAARAFTLSSYGRRVIASELAHVKRSCDEARACLANLGSLPLAVVTSSEHDPHHAPDGPAARKRSRWYAMWSVLQAEFAELSRNSSHSVARRAGHYVHRDDPDLVVGILRDLARSGTNMTRTQALPPVGAHH
jgi:pimeloyl-ACP methyl ester carboxylesterase